MYLGCIRYITIQNILCFESKRLKKKEYGTYKSSTNVKIHHLGVKPGLSSCLWETDFEWPWPAAA